jgi:hypothetical protein
MAPSIPPTPPAFTPAQLARLVELYERIDNLSATSAASSAQNAVNFGNAANELTRLERSYNDLMRDINSTRVAFAHIVDDIKGMNSGINRATKAFSGLESLASKLEQHQLGTNTLSSKELLTLQKKAQAKQADLILAKTIADQAAATAAADLANGRITQDTHDRIKAAQVEVNSQLTQNASATQTFNEQLISSINTQKQIEKSLGVTGSLMKGMAKVPFLGDLPGMADVMKEVEEEIIAIEKAEGRIVSKQEAMNMAFKKMSSVVKDSLTDPLVLAAITTKLLVSGFKALFEIGMKADTQVTNLSKSMAVSEEHAVATRDRFKEIQDAGGSIYETVTNLVGAQLELASAFGTTNGFSEQQLKDQILLTKQMGFTGEEAAGIQQLALANNKTAKDVTNSVIKQTATLAKQTGIQFDNKKIIGEVAKVSGQLSANYKNDPALIAKAVVQANKLGLTLEGAANASSKLLDFESSIQNELEAELLTGKDLNLEKARLLALNGDAAGAAAEMLGQVGSLSEFQNMNVLQQEALAKAVGMTANELANSLRQQENLNNLGDAAKLQIEEKAEELRKNGDIEGANRLMNSIGDEKEAQAALAKIDAQEKFTASMEKLKAILSSIVDGPGRMLVKAISSVVAFATRLAPIFKALAIVLAPIGVLLTAMWIRTKAIAIMSLIKSAWAGVGGIPVVGIAMALAAIGTGMAVINSQPAGDMYSPADGKTQVSTKEGGLFELSKNDSLMAFPEKKGSKNQSGGGGGNIDISPLIGQMQTMNAILSRIENKEGKVTMDSTQVGTSTNVGTYKVQ